MVTSVTSINKRKCKVFLEEGFAFVLYRSEVEQYHIEEGAELSRQVYERIEEEILLPRAREKALDFLSFQGRTRLQMKQKLKQEGYPENVIEKVMEFLKEYRFVDDVAYAKNYVSLNSGRKSCRQMKEELRLKGVCQEEIMQVLEEGEVDEEASALALMKKRLKGCRQLSREEKTRQSAYLARKGYSYDTIHRVMEHFATEETEDFYS